MKHKRKFATMLLIFLAITGLRAQEAANASGGEARGSGGTASYSVGQLVFSSLSNSSGTLTQGVQQPFDIQAITGINIRGIDLSLKAYPNPTSDFLTLRITDHPLNDLSYTLTDISGKTIDRDRIRSQETTIGMKHLVPAIYFVRVTDRNKTIKNFKIIKN